MSPSADKCGLCSKPFYGRQEHIACPCGARAHRRCIPSQKSTYTCNTCSPTGLNTKDIVNIRRVIHNDSLESSINFLLEEMLVIKEEVMQLKKANKENAQLKEEISILKEENNSLKNQLMAGNHSVHIVKSNTNTLGRTMADILRKPDDNQKKNQLNYLIVKNKGDSNCTEKTLQTKINPTKVGVKVKSFKKLLSGDVMIGCATKEELSIIKTEISNKCVDLNTIEKTQRNPEVVITGIPDSCNNEDINEAMEIATGEKCIHTKIIPGQHPRAICEVKPNAFNKLMDSKKINVGWIRCSVYETISIKQCFKCWRVGHKAIDCKITEESAKQLETNIKAGLCTNCISDKVSAKIKDNDSNNTNNSHHHPRSHKCTYLIKVRENIKKYINYTNE